MSAEPPPSIHPCQRLTTPDNKQVDIDTQLVSLVQTLWMMELVTTACCQDIGESAAGLRDPERTTPSGHGGFVEYYRGYAWLKMPLDDGRRFLNTLLDTSFHDRVTVRWQPGSWRMHVPLVHAEKNGIDLAYAAQIYFPRKQIAELTAILTDPTTWPVRRARPISLG
ncbi:MAG: hypothetical protein ACRDSF_19235 [Pseudonocardiaceae bacterium]